MSLLFKKLYWGFPFLLAELKVKVTEDHSGIYNRTLTTILVEYASAVSPTGNVFEMISKLDWWIKIFKNL